MVHEGVRPFRAAERSRLIDGTILGVPPAVEGNPLLEETGFERLRVQDPSPLWEEMRENPTLADRPQTGARIREGPVALDLPRAILAALALLVENDRRREPEDGDIAYYDAQRAAVAAGAKVTILSRDVDPSEELYLFSIGSDATDGVDTVEIVIDGDVAYRSPFTGMTLAEARQGRLWVPPRKAKRSLQVNVTNGGGAAKDVTVNARGWSRPRTMGTVQHEAYRGPGAPPVA